MTRIFSAGKKECFMKKVSPHKWSILIQSMRLQLLLLDLCGPNFHPSKSNKYSQKQPVADLRTGGFQHLYLNIWQVGCQKQCITILLKIKVYIWYQWIHEELLTSMKHFQCKKKCSKNCPLYLFKGSNLYYCITKFFFFKTHLEPLFLSVWFRMESVPTESQWKNYISMHMHSLAKVLRSLTKPYSNFLREMQMIVSFSGESKSIEMKFFLFISYSSQ